MLTLINKSNAQEFFALNAENDQVELSVLEKKVLFINLVGVQENFTNSTLKVEVPEGFKMLTALPKINGLKTGELIKLFLTIQALTTTEQGDYEMKVMLLDNNIVVGEYKLAIKLLENHDIELTPIAKPDKLSQNKTEIVSFLVRNTGNVQEHVILKSNSGAIIGNSEIDLRPGESQLIKTKNEIPENNQSIRLVTFDIRASIKSNEKPYSSVYTVPLVANQTSKNDPFLRIPINAGLQYNHFNSPTENIGALFFDIKGAGFIDFDEKHEIEFIAKGPNKLNLPRFGAINQYYFGYKSKKWGFNIGDRIYNVSNLSDRSRFAKGIQLSKMIGNGELSTFYYIPRYFSNIKKAYGVSFTSPINDFISGTVSFLNKEQIINQDLVQSQFLNFDTKFNRNNFEGVNELSFSTTSSKLAVGLYHNSNLVLGKFKLTNTAVFTGKNYFGFYTDGYQLNEYVSYSVSNKIQLGYSKNLMQINPSFDSYIITTAPYMNNDNVSVGYIFNKYHRARLTYMKNQREDKLNVQSYNYKERLLRYNYDAKFKGVIDLKIDGDIGKSLNFLADAESRKYTDQYRFRTYMGYQPFKMINAGAFVEYLNTQRFSAITDNNKFLYYGFNSSARINQMLNISLNYRNNFAPDELYKSQSYFDTNVSLRVGSHELGIMSSYSYTPEPLNQKNLFTSVKYTVDINTPVRKKRGLGRVLGQLDGVRVNGVVLFLNGKEVMTSLDGSFVFNDLPPGKYYLSTQKSTLGYGNIFDEEMPYLIEILPDQAKEVKLSVISTGKIIGNVKFTDAENVNKENVMIELFADNFSKLTTTDPFGGFQFSELKEGSYQMRIVSENIKKQFKVTSSDANIKVVKGEESLITFEMEAKRNQIKFQSERVILSSIQ